MTYWKNRAFYSIAWLIWSISKKATSLKIAAETAWWLSSMRLNDSSKRLGKITDFNVDPVAHDAVYRVRSDTDEEETEYNVGPDENALQLGDARSRGPAERIS